MAKEFRDFDKKYKHLIRLDAGEDSTMRMAAELTSKWEHPVKVYTHDQVRFATYFAPGSEEWQQFRVSMKGQSTKMKLARLNLRYLAAQAVEKEGEWELEKVRIDNYILALKRAGQLNENLEVVR